MGLNLTLSKPKPAAAAALKSALTEPPKKHTIDGLLDRRGGDIFVIPLPVLEFSCNHCSGNRQFASNVKEIVLPATQVRYSSHVVNYTCKNCSRMTKALAFVIETNVSPSQQSEINQLEPITLVSEFRKIGEDHPFGPMPTPALFKLFGVDRAMFSKGKMCEDTGFGIAAFAYYRRIIENQKDKILEALIQAAEKIGGNEILVQELVTAKNETQFTKAIDSVKSGLPESLRLMGKHNPLTLIHSALSEGLHAETDEECLKLAAHARSVLVALCERVSDVMNSDKELNAAVTALLNRSAVKGLK